jgi:HEPN domain-containing protein
MHADAKPWVDKAEGDYEGALTLVKKRSERVAHLTCFAAQQCAEKYMKAFLVDRNVPFSKTHDLTKDLLPSCLRIDDEFSFLFPYLESLDPYAVESRYPGEGVTHKDAVEAVKATKVIRKFIRGKLDLEKQRDLL